MSATAHPTTSVNPYAPGVRQYLAGEYVNGHMIGTPRLTHGFRPYVYRGTGRDELTAFMDREPGEPQRLSHRQERMETLASLRLWDGSDPVPPPGYVTAQQAAERLGVTRRTIERYKRELAGRTGRTT